MPRRGKGSKTGEQSPRQVRRRRLDEAVASFWQDRIRAAKSAKKPFSDAAKEVDAYFKSKHTALFDDERLKEDFMDLSGAAALSVPKAAQVRGALGPHLYPLNPQRNVSPKTSDAVMLGMSRVLSTYINKTPKEGKVARESRKTIDDSLLRGRGFTRTGYDPMLGIITSWYESSRNVLIDPDVDDWHDAEWIAIRKVLPLFRAKRQIKVKWRKQGLQGNYNTANGDTLEDTDKAKSSPLTNDLLECFDIYSKMGRGMLGADFAGGFKEDDNDFVKLTISLTHAVPLDEDEWDAPLYLDKEWLLEPIDFVETPDELWPESVMSQVMPLQKGLDLCATMLLHNVKMRSKVVVLGDKELPASQQRQIKHGSTSEYVAIKRKQGDKLSDMVHTLNFGTAPPELMELIFFLERQFEATTGLTAAVTGASEGAAKDRSATASRLRGQATNARLGDMRARVEEWATNVARKEALMVRLELGAEEVELYVKPDDIEMWMVSLTPSDEFTLQYKVAEFPVRDQRTEEERLQDQKRRKAAPLTLQRFSEGAATFFGSPDEAQNACVGLVQELLAKANDPDIGDSVAYALLEDMGVRSMDDLVVPGQPGPMGEPVMQLQLPPNLKPRPVEVEDVWSATSGVTAEELCRELSYEIAAGSMQKFDKSAEIELADTAMGQLMPIAAGIGQQTGSWDMANEILRMIHDAHEVPEDKRIQFSAPPPQPMAPPQGGE